eukprot:scaffold803_cov310-Pinguiococcus_pyrenoidosus.AAC.70
MMAIVFIFFVSVTAISNSEAQRRDFEAEAETDWPTLDVSATAFYESPARLADQRRELIDDVTICAATLTALSALSMVATFATACSSVPAASLI